MIGGIWSNYTVDVAWEEIKFMREHGSEFNRVAVVTDNQWQAWSAWVSNLFIDADVVVFSDYDEAKEWTSWRINFKLLLGIFT